MPRGGRGGRESRNVSAVSGSMVTVSMNHGLSPSAFPLSSGSSRMRSGDGTGTIPEEGNRRVRVSYSMVGDPGSPLSGIGTVPNRASILSSLSREREKGWSRGFLDRVFFTRVFPGRDELSAQRCSPPVSVRSQMACITSIPVTLPREWGGMIPIPIRTIRGVVPARWAGGRIAVHILSGSIEIYRRSSTVPPPFTPVPMGAWGHGTAAVFRT